MERNILLGYLFTVLNYGFYCASRFLGKKQKMLTLDLLAKISSVIGLAFLGSLSGAYSMVVNVGYLISANIKERKHYRRPGLYVLFQLALLWVMIRSYSGLPSILVFCSTSIALFAVWWLPPQKMRLAGLTANCFTLAYHLSLQNWAGLCEFAVIASNLTSYLKYRRAGEKQ